MDGVEPALHLRVLSRVSEVLAAQWDALLDGACTPFQRWDWLDAMESNGCAAPAQGWHPRHLTLWRGDRLVAAAPMYRRDDSSGEFVFDHGWAQAARHAGIRYFPKMVLAVPFTPCTGPRALVAAGEPGDALRAALWRAAVALAVEERCSSVHVLFPDARDEASLTAAGWALRRGVQFHWDNAGYADYDAFLARFDSKRRHQLRRERRAVAERGITLRTRAGDDLSPDDAGLLWSLYTSTADKFVWGRRYLNEAFFADVLTRFRPHLSLVEAVRDGRVVAGALNVASPTHLYGRYWGCFEEHPFLHFAVCYYHAVETCIAQGIQRFEGGAGGDHKLSRGFAPCVTHSAHWILHPGLDRAVRDFVGREWEAIQRELPALHAAAGLRALPGGGELR
jgi:predicted N-acyltransferase